MTDKDFSELQDLIIKLQTIAKKASKSNQIFKKYHSSSLELLDKTPSHLSNLISGLRVIEKKSINQLRFQES